MWRSWHFRRRKEYTVCLFMVSIYLLLPKEEYYGNSLSGANNITQYYLYKRICKIRPGSNGCNVRTINASNMFMTTDYASSLNNHTDTLSIPNITLKPEVEMMLNVRKVSKRDYALTADRPYLMENPDLCTDVRSLNILVIVHSAVEHFEHRRVIRETWTNNSYFDKLGTTRVLFLLGRSSRFQLKMENEFKRHGDLLQGDFIDAYRNLTLKNVMGLKWISERCKNAKIILKVDDDVVINMFYFLTYFAQYFLSKRNHMACVRLSKTKVLRVGKWSVKAPLFKGYTLYPDYCQGFMVAMSNDVIPSLYKSASLTPFFWIDDVFAYGFVSGNIPEITYTNLQIGKEVALKDSNAISCYERDNERCSYFVVLVRFGDVPKQLQFIWSLMVNEYQNKNLTFNHSFTIS